MRIQGIIRLLLLWKRISEGLCQQRYVFGRQCRGGQFGATFIKIGCYLAEIFEKEPADMRKSREIESLNSNPSVAPGSWKPGWRFLDVWMSKEDFGKVS